MYVEGISEQFVYFILPSAIKVHCQSGFFFRIQSSGSGVKTQNSAYSNRKSHDWEHPRNKQVNISFLILSLNIQIKKYLLEKRAESGAVLTKWLNPDPANIIRPVPKPSALNVYIYVHKYIVKLMIIYYKDIVWPGQALKPPEGVPERRFLTITFLEVQAGVH